MRGQCKFIFVKKCTILVSDVGNGGGHACVGTGDIRKICVSPSQFCCKPRASLKNKVLKKKKEKETVENTWKTKKIHHSQTVGQ